MIRFDPNSLYRFMNRRNYDDYDTGGSNLLNTLSNTMNDIALMRQLDELNRNPRDNYLNDIYRPQRGEYDPNYDPTSPTGKIGFQSGTKDLMSALRQRESGGNYGIRNSLGFSGAYQFGAPALETVGYLKSGAGKLGNQALKDPNNWTIPGGLEAFLGNRELQDIAMQKLMASNKQRLENMGLINQKTPPNILNAMLSAAHLAGPGGVKALLMGRNRRDAYGTPASEYFNLGLRTR